MLQIASQKRPMFSDEQEVRVLLYDPNDLLNDFKDQQNPLGRSIAWDVSKHIEAIRVHPESDESFSETVAATVRLLAPGLSSSIQRSDMSVTPIETYLPLISKSEDSDSSA